MQRLLLSHRLPEQTLLPLLLQSRQASAATRQPTRPFDRKRSYAQPCHGALFSTTPPAPFLSLRPPPWQNSQIGRLKTTRSRGQQNSQSRLDSQTFQNKRG